MGRLKAAPRQNGGSGLPLCRLAGRVPGDFLRSVGVDAYQRHVARTAHAQVEPYTEAIGRHHVAGAFEGVLRRDEPRTGRGTPHLQPLGHGIAAGERLDLRFRGLPRAVEQRAVPCVGFIDARFEQRLLPLPFPDEQRARFPWLEILVRLDGNRHQLLELRAVGGDQLRDG